MRDARSGSESAEEAIWGLQRGQRAAAALETGPKGCLKTAAHGVAARGSVWGQSPSPAITSALGDDKPGGKLLASMLERLKDARQQPVDG